LFWQADGGEVDLMVLIGGAKGRAAMFAETSNNSQYSTRLIPSKPESHAEFQRRKQKVKDWGSMLTNHS
jgi:hypothetical protein